MVQKILDTTAAAAEATAAPELVKANAEFEHIHGETSSFHTPMDEFFCSSTRFRTLPRPAGPEPVMAGLVGGRHDPRSASLRPARPWLCHHALYTLAIGRPRRAITLRVSMIGSPVSITWA